MTDVALGSCKVLIMPAIIVPVQRISWCATLALIWAPSCSLLSEGLCAPMELAAICSAASLAMLEE